MSRRTNRFSPADTTTRVSSSITTFIMIQRLQLYIGCVSGISGSGHTRMSHPDFSNISGTLTTRSGLMSSLPGASGWNVASMCMGCVSWTSTSCTAYSSPR